MDVTERGATRSAGSIYEVLWTRFLDGTYAAGDRLREAALAEELGVSRTPVREALGRMLAEGLVTPVARGVVVSSLDHDAMRRLFDFRRNLEGFATALTTARSRDGLIAPVWFVRLKESARDFSAAVEGGQAADAAQSNMRFHELIVEESGNEFVTSAHRRAIARLAVSTALNLEHANWAREAARQHELIAEAIAEGNVDGARDLAEAHITDATRVFDGVG
ncbi:MAG: GntR family transcriptional regulator [Stackebrandtia sp.]